MFNQSSVPSMKIYLSEINELGRDITIDGQSNPWLMKTVRALDEEEIFPTPIPEHVKLKREQARTASAHFNLRKVDQVYVVQGHVETAVRLLCSRSGDPFLYPIRLDFTSLYTKDPSMAGVSQAQSSHEAKPHGTKGIARTGRRDEIDYDMEITLLDGELLDLSTTVDEQLRLAIPVQPISDAYRDRPHEPVDTRGRAERPWKENAFSALKGFKVSKK